MRPRRLELLKVLFRHQPQVSGRPMLLPAGESRSTSITQYALHIENQASLFRKETFDSDASRLFSHGEYPPREKSYTGESDSESTPNTKRRITGPREKKVTVRAPKDIKNNTAPLATPPQRSAR